MKKVAILSIILFTSVLLYGQDDIINREANILSDSLRKNFNRKEFKVSVQGEDSLFTYIPVETGQRADLSEKAVNNNNSKRLRDDVCRNTRLAVLYLVAAIV